MARCAAPPPSSSVSHSPSTHPRALFRTCGNSTMIALASSGRSHGQTRCGCVRRRRIVRCKSRAPCSARWARELGRGQCTRNRRPCVPSVSSHGVTRELIRPQIDSLVPAYACPVADAVRDAFEEVPAWTEHLSENAPLKARLDAVFGTEGLDAWASWCM